MRISELGLVLVSSDISDTSQSLFSSSGFYIDFCSPDVSVVVLEPGGDGVARQLQVHKLPGLGPLQFLHVLENETRVIVNIIGDRRRFCCFKKVYYYFWRP